MFNNKYFTTIGQKLASKLDKSASKFESYLGPKCQKKFHLGKVELHEIIDEINSICEKKGMGFDNIPPKIIKWVPHLFGPILTHIYNKCI